MDAETINQTFDLLALAEGDTTLKRAGGFYIGPCPFCGGRDRFNMKKSHSGWRWYCRKCGGEKYHGAIDYIMRRDNLDFKQALESMGGKVYAAPQRSPAAVKLSEVPKIELPNATWQALRWHEVTQASEALECDPAAQLARDYLQLRGLDRSTWLIYLLGFTVVYKRPALTIPWFDDVGGTVTAIKYRFIDKLARQDADRRFGMAAGSRPIVFGLNNAASKDTLVLCEGEINAMSFAQLAPDLTPGLDALSFGSQAAAPPEILRKVADDYQRVIVWADEPRRANEIRRSLWRAAEALCSPVIEGTKYDANALLQIGLLAEFIQQTILEPSHGK